MSIKYEIEEYIAKNGKTPFSDWAGNIKDKTRRLKEKLFNVLNELALAILEITRASKVPKVF